VLTKPVGVNAQTCNDPMQYSSVKAEPQWGALGRRLGKSLAKVKEGMKALTTAQLMAYEAGATLEVEGFAMGPGDITVKREFQMPEGRSADELDAGGDGDVLVLLELVQDESLLQAG
jgi:isoleucyl-tRNA synthetase